MCYKKKLTAHFLLGIIFIPTLLLFAVQINKSFHRHIIKAQLENSSLQKVVLPISEVHWVKVGEEILVAGEMFDVHHIQELPNNQIAIYGLSDKKEDQLNQEVDILMNKKKELATIIIKTALWVMLDLTTTNYVFPYLLITQAKKYAAHFSAYFSITQEIIAPPPRTYSFL